MDEIIKLDSSFNKAMFITKVNNIFIMLHTAIMLDDLDRVRHFISDDLEQKYEKLLNEHNSNNLRKIYDELNVKTTEIRNFKVQDDKLIINVVLVSRYMEYFLNKKTGEYVSGDNTKRIEKVNNLVFEKKIGTNYKLVRQCPTCGASIDVNANGKCPYCRTIFNAEDYDWILTSID